VSDPAERIATCEESGDFPGDKSLVFLLRHRLDHPAAVLSFGAYRCTVTDPAEIVTIATGQALFYQYHPALFRGAPPPRPGLYRFRWDGLQQDGEWAGIASGEHEVRGPASAPRASRRKLSIFGRRGEQA